jgi:uncharacterized protein DUF6894
MRTYYFDLQDGIAVRDRKGLAFVSGGAAIEHSKRLAKLIRDKRQPDRKDINVVVLDEDGREIHREVVYPAAS